MGPPFECEKNSPPCRWSSKWRNQWFSCIFLGIKHPWTQCLTTLAWFVGTRSREGGVFLTVFFWGGNAQEGCWMMTQKKKPAFFTRNTWDGWKDVAPNLIANFSCVLQLVFELVFRREWKLNCPHRARLVDLIRVCSRTSSSCIWEAPGRVFERPKEKNVEGGWEEGSCPYEHTCTFDFDMFVGWFEKTFHPDKSPLWE